MLTGIDVDPCLEKGLKGRVGEKVKGDLLKSSFLGALREVRGQSHD